MKLKYYMRGLGIGVILTTLILTLGNGKISDDEVIKRATALGMIFEEEADNLNEMLGKGEAVIPSQTPSNTPTLEPTPTAVITPEPPPTVTLAPTKAPLPTDDPSNEHIKDKMISFTIKRGIGSKEVAEVLAQVGLIQDPIDFNKYIVKAGMASNIKASAYKIKENSSYDEIIEIITAN